MAIVSVFSGAFCREEEIILQLLEKTGYALVNDDMLVHRAAALSALPADRLERTFSARSSVFNPFTRERERSLAWLKLALAESLQKTEILLHGFAAHLVPRSIHHVLRLCLIADRPYRVEVASSRLGVSESEASACVQEEDRHRAFWVRERTACPDPWDPALYDLVLPTNKVDAPRAASLVEQGLAAKALQPSASSRQAARDFLAAARIETHLAGQGDFVEVTVKEDEVVLMIDRPVLMIERLEEELKTAVRAVKKTGLIQVRTKPGAAPGEIYRRYDSHVPSKVLLVDDEREFVQTLSERLGMRDIGSAAAFDGESALAMVSEEEPEVMLLDLRMPGIDGIEVLKRVKAEHPDIEVVILTGHGTDVDRKECMALGAFAYLEKPVDIDVLSETLKQANEKMRKNAHEKMHHNAKKKP